MKTELEILIEHLQNEVAFLQKALNHCVSEQDFQGAEKFKQSLMYTSRKLSTTESLQNPNYGRIRELEGTVLRMEKGLTTENLKQGLEKEERERLKKTHRRFTRRSIERYREELQSLESSVQEFRIDDDEIYDLMEQLECVLWIANKSAIKKNVF